MDFTAREEEGSSVAAGDGGRQEEQGRFFDQDICLNLPINRKFQINFEELGPSEDKDNKDLQIEVTAYTNGVEEDVIMADILKSVKLVVDNMEQREWRQARV